MAGPYEFESRLRLLLWGSAVSRSTSISNVEALSFPFSPDPRTLTQWRKPVQAIKTIVVQLLLSITLLSISFAQGAPPQGAADQLYVMEYYYKVQWGHQQEFLQLFLKNHYPLLKKQIDSGRMLSVKIETPANHMTEDARWDYRVTIRFRNSTVATTGNPDEEQIIKQLWPDQETYKKEEQRRFEILLAHWDIPVSDVTPKK